MKRSGAVPGIDAKVAFLRRPEAYTRSTCCVTAHETHMSWVFLTDAEAWKLKKPSRYNHADFRTAEARRRNSEEEVRLNRRLAQDVYLGVVPLALDEGGNMQLGGRGRPIDWLVHMRRLEADLMLDRAIERGTTTDEDAWRLAFKLARFYTESPPVATSEAQYRRELSRDVGANLLELTAPRYGLPRTLVESVCRETQAFLRENPAFFDERVRKQRIVEAHGDLRPEHVCLEPVPVIIDCLEFDRKLRLLDAVSELGFFSLECDRLGAPWFGKTVLETYASATGDIFPDPLLRFYKAYHASQRAKVAIWHLNDAVVPAPSKWVARAVEYLKLGSTVWRAV